MPRKPAVRSSESHLASGPSLVAGSDRDGLQSYARSLPEIYKDILASFPKIEPARHLGDGIAVQTIYGRMEELKKPYSLGEIREACANMAEHGVVEIKHNIFVYPTELGERIIAALFGGVVPRKSVPPFPPLPVAVEEGKS